MNTGDGNNEKTLKALVGRRTTVAQYLSSSSSSASQAPMTQSYCSYPHRTCMRNKLEGFDYCIRHILEDRNAPYRQCSYVSSRTGHKCSEAAFKTEKRERFVLFFEDFGSLSCSIGFSMCFTLWVGYMKLEYLNMFSILCSKIYVADCCCFLCYCKAII